MGTNNGGPAFPVIGAPGAPEDYPGMTLRDYFAAKAMAALIALEPDRDRTGMDGVDFVAEGSYAIADAMLAARGDE